MKKLVLFAAIAVAVSFASCKKTAETPPVAPETDNVEATITEEEGAINEDVVEVIEVETTEATEAAAE